MSTYAVTVIGKDAGKDVQVTVTVEAFRKDHALQRAYRLGLLPVMDSVKSTAVDAIK